MLVLGHPQYAWQPFGQKIGAITGKTWGIEAAVSMTELEHCDSRTDITEPVADPKMTQR